MSNDPLTQFLDAISKIAPTPGVVFRGLPEDEPAPTGTTILGSPVPASADPWVAREGRPGRVLVLLTRTARDLTALSARPQDREAVLLPGTVWLRVAVPELPDDVVLEEIDPDGRPAPTTWPPTRGDLVEQVRRRLAEPAPAGVEPLVGKYRGPWPAASVTPGR